MRKNRLLPALFLLIFTTLFVYGVMELLILRFQKGDVYPSYSSFRSDPLGTKAFYEGLSLLPGLEILRNVEPLTKPSILSDATIFFFGVDRYGLSRMPERIVKGLEEAAAGGGRLVISFPPPKKEEASQEKVRRQKEDQKEAPDENAGKKPDDEREEREFYEGKYVNLYERWFVETGFSSETEEEAKLSASEKDLPDSLAWRSKLFFKPRDDSWHTLYIRSDEPVLIERSYGKGSIVLSADSYFISNEAMRNRRYPALLAWLCGNHRRIIFDETHLGITKHPGIATLLRKYGLTSFFIALIVLALLAVWKQAALFVPASEEDEKKIIHVGKDDSTGLTNLLRRNISPDEVLPVCLEEWKRAFLRGKQNLSALLPGIQEIITEEREKPKKGRNPVRVYRKVSALGMRR